MEPYDLIHESMHTLKHGVMPETVPHRVGPPLAKTSLSFQSIHERIKDTEYGDNLAGNVRFDLFRPDHVSEKDWVYMLGSDVHNLEHMPLTYRVMRMFLRDGRMKREGKEVSAFSEAEKEILLLVADTHDWAEAVVGDDPWIFKTAEDAREEILVYQQLLHELLDDFATPGLVEQCVHVLTEPDSKLGRAFEMIEKTGYVRTGLNASDAVKHTADKALQDSLQALTVQVMTNHFYELLQTSETFPWLYNWIMANRERFMEVFENTPMEIVKEVTEAYGEGQTAFYKLRSIFMWWCRMIELKKSEKPMPLAPSVQTHP